MTLNLNKSRVLRGLIGDDRCFESAPFVDATTYDAFVDTEFPTWAAAYAAGNLYATAEDNTTYKVEGLDQFPNPPKKNP